MLGLKNKRSIGRSRKATQSGFTLLEVMMALIVISVGLVALVQSSQYSAHVLQQAKTKTAAYHVADQVLLKMYQIPDLSIGRHQGEQKFEGTVYYWQASLATTENKYINRLDVRVFLDRKFDYAEATLTGFKQP